MAQCIGRCISKSKTGKHKGEIQNTPMKKKFGKQRNPNNNQKKNKYTQKVHLKTSCDNPLGN
jgi:hypothetical protein